MTELNLAVIAGDGIGTEVVAEGLKVLDAVSASAGLTISTTDYDLGARRYNATGETLPASVLAELRGQDAILLGAIGDPSVPPGVLERGVLLPLRFELDHHVNLRPVKLFAGVSTPLAGKTPADIDMVVCREGTEGPYVGSGGTLRRGTAHEVATEESLNTRFGVERIVRDAFARAEGRRGKVTLVHKTNVLVHAGSLWQRTFTEVAAEHPAITTDYCHVDAAAMFFLTQPERFDVVVTDNLFGDILTDIGAAIAGGSAWRPVGTSIPAGPTPACSSRCTDPPRTSPGRARQIRRRRSCRSRCSWPTSGTRQLPIGWRPPSRPTWPRGAARCGPPARSATPWPQLPRAERPRDPVTLAVEGPDQRYCGP